MKYFLIPFLILSCTKYSTYNKANATNTSKYSLNCEYLERDYIRCENNEVICYQTHRGLQCKFKEFK